MVAYLVTHIMLEEYNTINNSFPLIKIIEFTDIKQQTEGQSFIFIYEYKEESPQVQT